MERPLETTIKLEESSEIIGQHVDENCFKCSVCGDAFRTGFSHSHEIPDGLPILDGPVSGRYYPLNISLGKPRGLDFFYKHFFLDFFTKITKNILYSDYSPFSSRKSLNCHVAGAHNFEKCPFCSKTFKFLTRLKEHLKVCPLYFNTNPDNKCNVCGEEFS